MIIALSHFWKIRDVTDIEQMSHKWKNRRWSDDQISCDGLNMCSSANRRRWTIAGSMLTHPLRRSTNIEPAMNKRLVFSGRGYTCIVTNQFTIDTRVSWRPFTGGASLPKFGKFPLRPPPKKVHIFTVLICSPQSPPPLQTSRSPLQNSWICRKPCTLSNFERWDESDVWSDKYLIFVWIGHTIFDFLFYLLNW